jgi:hypothetical protein
VTISISPHQLRSDVLRLLQKEPGALVIGLHAIGRWAGDGVLQVGEHGFAVVPAQSVLEVRGALEAAERERRRTVILTALDQSELGHDVVARLARARLFPLDLWQAVLGLFDARQLDPSLRQRCLAQALLDHAPPSGKYPPVAAGVLDAGTAWKAILHHSFELEDREPDLAGLLRWASAGAEKFLSAPDELREATRSRLTATLGPAATSVLNFVESGAARESLALAIACEVIFAEGTGDSGLHQAAAARLERFHLNEPIPWAVGCTLARAAADALDDLAREDSHADQAHRLRADAILREIQARPLAHLGRLTPMAFDARLQVFAGLLEGAIAGADPQQLDALERAVKQIEDHDLARQATHLPRVERARMAVRLVRWLRTDADRGGSFGDLSRRYRDELAYVDWARDTLSGGEEQTELSRVYGQVERVVSERRELFNRCFGRALADWTASDSDPGMALRVEDALARAVAPVLQARLPVLVIVLDGLSWAVARELLSDLKRQHWAEARLPGTDRVPAPVVAAIPSVTEVSRTSLLAGFLVRGSQDDERRLFPAHHALLAHCERGYAPRVFHKRDLTEGARGSLGKAVETAILEPRQRIVGVVINAIDDRLAGASQVRDVWAVESIRPLGSLLRLAREAGRVVVLASDHGHVWQRDAAITSAEDAGSRWRPADREAGAGEVLLEGDRVRGPGDGHRLIAPWSEGVRYGTLRNGYHGGATPQEMIAPLILLTDVTARQPALEPHESPRPAWWDVTQPARATSVRPPAPQPTARIPEGYLFPLAPVESTEIPVAQAAPADERREDRPAAWLERLFQSPAYRSQKQMVRKFAPEDEMVRKVIDMLDRGGGSMTPVALANRLGIPGIRIDGLIAKVQRILNVDGYEALRLDRRREIVELDVPLLKRQFELP